MESVMIMVMIPLNLLLMIMIMWLLLFSTKPQTGSALRNGLCFTTLLDLNNDH